MGHVHVLTVQHSFPAPDMGPEDRRWTNYVNLIKSRSSFMRGAERLGRDVRLHLLCAEIFRLSKTLKVEIPHQLELQVDVLRLRAATLIDHLLLQKDRS